MDFGQHHPIGRIRRAALPLAAGLAYTLIGRATVDLTDSQGGIAPIWIANALLLALMLLRPRTEAVAILATGLLGNAISILAIGGSIGEAIFYPAANGIEILVALYGLKIGDKQNVILRAPESVGRVLLWAGLLAPSASAALGAVISWHYFGHPLLIGFGLWFMAGSLGLLIFTPFFLTLLSGEILTGPREMTGRQRLEFCALLALTTLVITHIFFWARHPLLFFIVVPMMLVTFRTGWLGSKIAIALIALIGGIGTVTGHGPIAAQMGSADAKVYGIQIFVAVMLLVQMPIAGALAAQRDLVRKLRESEQSLRLLASRSPILLVAFDLGGRCERVVGTSDILLDRTPQQLGGASFAEVSEEGQYVLGRAHSAALEDISRSHAAEFRTVKTNDAWLEAVFRAHFDETGRCIGTIATIHDVTTRKNQELSLSLSAKTDSLTGLLNRAGFRQSLDQALLGATPGALSIAVIDVDRFKLINDNSGHQVGDIVLREIARRIASEVRSGDAVGRLGGDEFVVLLSTGNWLQVQEICARMVEIVANEPIRLPSGNMLHVAISCGVARYAAGLTAEELIHEADVALYQAKRAGRNRVVAA